MTPRLALLLALYMHAVSASPNIDEAWFERCQPSDGAYHALGFGSGISFHNPLEREAGELFLIITVGPLGRLSFGSNPVFTAVAPDGAVARNWAPSLTHADNKPAGAPQREAFVKVGRLSNGGLNQRRYRVAIAAGTDLPDRFTLVIPPLTNFWKDVTPLQVQFKRFGSERYVRICGVNGLTTSDRPYRPPA